MKKNRKLAPSKTANAVIPPEGLIRAWIRFSRGRRWVPVSGDFQTLKAARQAIRDAIAAHKLRDPNALVDQSRIRLDFPKKKRPAHEPRYTIAVKLRPAKRRHQN